MMTTKRSMFAIDGDQDFGLVSNQITKAKSPSSSPNSSDESDVNRKSDVSAAEEVECDDCTNYSSDNSSDDDEVMDALYSNSIIATLGLKESEKKNTSDDDDESEASENDCQQKLRAPAIIADRRFKNPLGKRAQRKS